MPPTGHSQTPGQPLWALPTPDASSTTSCLSGSNRHSSTWAKSPRVAGIHCEADRSPSSLGINSCFVHLSYAPKPQNCSPKEAGEVSALVRAPTQPWPFLASTYTGGCLLQLRTLPAVPPEAKKGLSRGALLPSLP